MDFLGQWWDLDFLRRAVGLEDDYTDRHVAAIGAQMEHDEALFLDEVGEKPLSPEERDRHRRNYMKATRTVREEDRNRAARIKARPPRTPKPDRKPWFARSAIGKAFMRGGAMGALVGRLTALIPKIAKNPNVRAWFSDILILAGTTAAALGIGELVEWFTEPNEEQQEDAAKKLIEFIKNSQNVDAGSDPEKAKEMLERYSQIVKAIEAEDDTIIDDILLAAANEEAQELGRIAETPITEVKGDVPFPVKRAGDAYRDLAMVRDDIKMVARLLGRSPKVVAAMIPPFRRIVDEDAALLQLASGVG